MANTIADDIAQIRTAIYGREVRESIAHGIEQCYSNTSEGKTLADAAAENANEKARDAETATERANTAAVTIDSKVNDIVLVQEAQPTSESNRIWVKPVNEEYKIPSWEEFQELSAKVDELMEWKEQHS